MPSVPPYGDRFGPRPDHAHRPGPAQDGTPLEIGILDLNGEDPVVIHAMRLRPKFCPLIRQR